MVLGRGEDVEQAAADGELATILHLLDALVAGGHELGGALVQIQQVASPEREAVRAQPRVGDLLGQRDRADDHDGRAVVLGGRCVEERVERRDAESDEVGRRREVRLVRDAAARVEAHAPRREPGSEVGREVARVAVVAGDDEERLPGILVRERRDHVGLERGADERTAAPAGEGGGLRVVGGVGEEGAEHGSGHAERPRSGCAACL